MATLPNTGPLWHLIERPRAPFHCDVCGAAIPDDQWGTFTTLPKMYYDTPPSGFTPCKRGFDPIAARYSNTVDPGGGEPSSPGHSSDDLHPETGARFVFEREPGELPRYRVAVYLPAQRQVACALGWDTGGAARLDPEPTDAWVAAEILKLARVLHRDPKARLTRWRGA